MNVEKEAAPQKIRKAGSLKGTFVVSGAFNAPPIKFRNCKNNAELLAHFGL